MTLTATPEFAAFEVQARAPADRLKLFYGRGVDSDAMAVFLAQAAKAAREKAGRKQVHIAAELNSDQSTVYRFEQGRWPRDPDGMIAAYAADLDIDAINLWIDALDRWRAAGAVREASEKVSDDGSPVFLPGKPPAESKTETGKASRGARHRRAGTSRRRAS